MKVLVTGATGFVGSHLCKRLVGDGWEVHAIARATSDFSQIEDIKDNIRFHIHDDTMENMNSIVAECKPEIVFHLASIFISEHKPEDIIPLLQSNIFFGTQLVEAMTGHDVLNLINTGTSWQHYENSDYNPVNLYAATKQAFEDILKYYSDANNLRVITLELSDTYGPYDPRPKLVNLLRGIAKAGNTLKMSPGDQYIDLVYIDDVVDAFLCAAKLIQKVTDKQMESFAASSGRPIRLKEFVNIFEQVFGGKLNIEWGKRPYRKREVMKLWNRGKPLPGWKAKVELQDGLRNIFTT